MKFTGEIITFDRELSDLALIPPIMSIREAMIAAERMSEALIERQNEFAQACGREFDCDKGDMEGLSEEINLLQGALGRICTVAGQVE